MKKHEPINPRFPHFMHGGDYNPDQWMHDPHILDEDMRLMKLAHCNTMSVGIFSWAALEPEEGKYDFSFLDETLDRLYQNGGRAVLATPSGARPRWMAEKYPEVLRVSLGRVRQGYGVRHNHCFTSPVYREKVAQINRKLAERYGNHPAVVAWHLSNEYGGECHCPLCQEAFREWLKRKYDGDLERLNHEWWTGFWSHQITSWDQIESPALWEGGERGTACLDGLTVDWRRFVTDQTADFMRAEAETVKSIAPNIPVTTNMMGVYEGLNYWRMKDDVDFISFDSYPRWHSPEGNETVASDIAFQYDLNRCLKQKPFMLMESTPSKVNWHSYCKPKRPGMHMLSCMQAVAHGSDTVQYFQWRKGRGGFEKLHGAVVDHKGDESTREFQDVAAVGAALEKMDGVIGTGTRAEVAIVFDWETRWCIQASQGYQNERSDSETDRGYLATCCQYYHAFWKRGINVDVIDSGQDLSGYRLVVAPMLYSASESVIERLTSYVDGGGTLIGTYLTGEVNENNLCYLGGFPGGTLQDVFGLWAEEVDTLYPGERNGIRTSDGAEFEVQRYCERIHPSTAETVAVYTDEFYAGESAVCVNRYGAGTSYYVACRDTGAYSDRLCGELVDALSLTRAVASLPDGCTAHTREGDGETYLFLENYASTPCEVTVDPVCTDVLTGETVSGATSLGAYGVRVLRYESED